MKLKAVALGLAGLAGAILLGPMSPSAQTAAVASAPAKLGPAVAYRRLTESQYRNAIRDVFGPAVQINARFEPERREEGLQAVGNSRVSITTSGMEQYYSAARGIADQVVDGKDRDTALGCSLGADARAQASCADHVIKTKGAQLFRRPVTAEEAATYNAIFAEGLKAYGDAPKALKQAIVGMLMSPEYLFRVERSETAGGAVRLDGYSKAARMSYMLWNSAPDAELLSTVRSGEIHSDAGLKKQVDRMLASPKLADGVRAFFTDMLEFEAFDTLSKDTATYPKFSQAVADSAREETLRFLVNELVTKNGDYRDVFTSRDTFIDRTLAYVYNVPFLSADKWSAYSFDTESERSGLLTQVTFLSLFSHPAASSPTVRGVKLNEIFMCLFVPQPPPDVDFSKVQALEKGTVRVRLIDHMSNEGCAGCHMISDPPGLALERFDGLGQHRTLENNEPIDVSATIGAHKFLGAEGLGQWMKTDPMVPACLVKKANAYGVGRVTKPADQPYIRKLETSFKDGGYRVPALFRSILTDPYFYKVPAPEAAPAAPARTASLSVPQSSIPHSSFSGDGR